MEIYSGEEEVVQELTEVVHAGYYSQNDQICDISYKALIREYPIASRIIILTEGKTDAEILQRSLKVLYPHLSDYYSFMDFGIRPSGGAGDLVNIVKSFAGSGIQNRTIAIFDNDTAAHSAVSILNQRLIPSNIIILHYPRIAIATDYPTLGPSGLVRQDINGLACSIELYFGSEVLKLDSDYVPIQWGGLDERLNRYQGSIIKKDELQKRFFEKLRRCENNRNEISNADWVGIDSIFQRVIRAFYD
jgi:hypothetical protein